MPKGESFADIWAPWRQQARTNAKGKTRRSNFRVDYKVPFLVVNPDAKAANARYAEVIRDIIREDIQAITREVKPSTVARRERAARDRDSPWYNRRYRGGRTGETPPAPADGRVATRYALDSGRLVDTLHVGLRTRSNEVEAVATLNVAANRLDPRYFGGAAAFRLFVTTLRELAPALAGRFDASAQRTLTRELSRLARDAVAESKAAQARKKRERLRAFARLGREFLRFV